MNKRHLNAILVGVVFSLTAGQAAMADNYNLQITGTIVADTCDVDSSTTEQTVDLGSFSASDFPTVGSVTAYKPFNINLKDCTSGIAGTKIWFTGTQDSNNSALLALSDTGMGLQTEMATGIGVEILNENQEPIPINNTESAIFPLQAGQNTLGFYLRYKSTLDKVTAGDATAIMYFDMQYQ